MYIYIYMYAGEPEWPCIYELRKNIGNYSKTQENLRKYKDILGGIRIRKFAKTERGSLP